MQAFEPLWGTWYLEEMIGAGTYGTVYRAKQEILGKTYYSAVKHISIPKDEAELRSVQEELATEDPETLNRYYDREIQNILKEFEIQKQFAGKEHFVLVYDVLPIHKKEMPGYDLFIRMELLQSIHTRFRNTDDPEAEAIRLGMQICTGLRDMHRMKFIHRDIKPQNLLVSEDGVYKIADFGTVRKLSGSTAFMSIKGSLDYMSPEMISGAEVGYTADLYALGLVLYRLLNHWRLPFVTSDSYSEEQRSTANAMRLAGEKLPPPENASEGMANVILKACAYEPAGRFQSAEEMLQALEKLSRESGKNEKKQETESLWAGLRRCGEELGSEETGQRLWNLQRRIRQLPEGTPGTLDLEECHGLLLRLRAIEQEQKKEDAKRTEQLRMLSDRMQTSEAHLGEPATTGSLDLLLQEIHALNPGEEDVYAAESRCLELMEKHRAAAHNRAIEQQAEPFRRVLETFRKEGGGETAEILVPLLSARLESLKSRKLSGEKADARENVEKKDPPVPTTEAPVHGPDPDLPVPKSRAQSKWKVVLSFLLGVALVQLIHGYGVFAGLWYRQHWTVVLLISLPLAYIPALLMYAMVSVDFNAVRKDADTVECSWYKVAGKTYGIVLDGAWVTQQAESPLRLACRENGDTKRTLMLVEMSEKPRIVSKKKV
ncbi:MAG: protein kinase [Clostridia bacterium]|nr:protein kinase [Clostridia bacterium]